MMAPFPSTTSSPNTQCSRTMAWHMSQEAVTYDNSFIEDDMCQEDGIVAKHAILADDRVRTDMRTHPYSGTGCHHRGGVDAGLVGARLVEGCHG